MSARTLLAVAVQNTHTMAGVFSGAELVSHWRVSTNTRRTADEWGLLFDGLLDLRRSIHGLDVGRRGSLSARRYPAVVAELRLMAADRFN